MNPINSLIVEGNLTRDPEFKETSGGFKVCNISIAVNRSYKNSEGKKIEEVSYFDVETFGSLAENCARYCEKGRGVRVVGRIKQNRWTNQDGKPQARIMIVAEHIEFKPKFNQPGTETTTAAASATEPAAETIAEVISKTISSPSEPASETVTETAPAGTEISEKVPEEALVF